MDSVTTLAVCGSSAARPALARGTLTCFKISPHEVMAPLLDLGHRQLKIQPGDDVSADNIRIMQVTDLHHFPKDCKCGHQIARKSLLVACVMGHKYFYSA